MAETNPSSFVFEEAFRSAALLDGDGQEVGSHIRHHDLLHVADGGPPRHFIQVQVESGWGRPVHEVRLLHLGRLHGAAQAWAHSGLVLEGYRSQVAGAVLSPVRVCSVGVQASL